MSKNRLRVTPMAEAAREAQPLIDLLNAETPDPRLLECFRIARELGSKPVRVVEPDLPGVTTAPLLAQQRLLSHLNRNILSGFSFRPCLYESARKKWAIQWIPVYAPHPTDPPSRLAPPDGWQSVPVNAGIVVILEMLAEGTLERLRKCSECQEWFFAVSDKKRVCGGLCRYRKFKQIRTNAERAKYMREHRKNPRVKAKRRANGKTQK